MLPGGNWNLEARTWRFPSRQRPGGPEACVDLNKGHLAILRQARGRAVGQDSYVFASRQGVNEPFVDEAISMSLRRAGYELVPRDLLEAHNGWRGKTGVGGPQDVVGEAPAGVPRTSLNAVACRTQRGMSRLAAMVLLIAETT